MVVVDPNKPGTSDPQGLATDWNKCVLCQEGTDEIVICPSYSAHRTGGAGYKTIADHLEVTCQEH